MSSNISINSGAQRVTANSGVPARQTGKFGEAEGKFSDHFADSTVGKKSSGGLVENREAEVDGELPSERGQPTEVEIPENGILKVDLQEIPVGDLKISVKNDDAVQLDLEPLAMNVEAPSVEAPGVDSPGVELPRDSAKDVIVPPAVAPAEVGKSLNAVKSQNEGTAAGPVAVANAKNVVGRREGSKVDQGETGNKDLPTGDVDDGLETAKSARTMERPLERTIGRGRAHGVIENIVEGRVEGEKSITLEKASNSSAAMKPERAATGMSNAHSVRGAESRLASMMEASGTFDGDVKITAGKQENHILPALPQQLTVAGMSRTVVSQVLELRQSGDLEMMGRDVKTDANKPVKVIEVQLMPRNLGTVGITIRNVAGRINISIEVQGAEAERLIKNEVDKIVGAIRQAGQVVEDISIKRGVQMSQQTDSLTDDRETGRQGEANFDQNSGNPMWQSSHSREDEGSNPQRFDEIGVQERGEITTGSDKAARQGIYL
ncbi:MAG: flagellar hook-length control protein FliK [Rhizobiaceae bacterium]